MKKNIALLLIFFLFSLIINAQNSYEKLWLEVERIEINNLPKSANKKVEAIYEKAIREDNSPQVIKSLLYKSKFSLITEEDATLKIIEDFKTQIDKSTAPTKNVLESVLANLYWQYFQRNRYKFYNRTKTENKVDANDFRTWDLDTLFEEIHCYYNASLENSKETQQTSIASFSDILDLGKKTHTVHPTLFDFIANNALTFYKTPESSITKPAYEFKLNNPAYLKEATTFLNMELTTKDKLSLQFNALKVYQQLMQFHYKKQNLNALAHIDIERFYFVKSFGTFNNLNSLLLKSYKVSLEENKNHESAALYAYEIAQIYNNQANEYSQNKKEIHRFKNIEALAICNQFAEKYPKSIGGLKCVNLKNTILQKSVKLTTEKYIPILKHSKILASYKNVNNLFFKAYKITPEEENKLNNIYNTKDKEKAIAKLQLVKSWQKNLRDEKDYLNHTTEIVIPELKQGYYLILASEKDGLKDNSTYGTTTIQVTNLVLTNNNLNEINKYQVLNRNTGKPIANAIIHLKNEKRNRQPHINKKLTTDLNGFATFKSNEYYNNVQISVATKDDNAFFGNRYLNLHRTYKTRETENYIKAKPFIFTDRSIYRPGQKIYFKTIVLKKQINVEDSSEVLANEGVTVTLYDVNNQIIKTENLTLNEFGSVAGEFDLPNNGLTGQFSIDVSQGSKLNPNSYEYFNNARKNFSVEEYKRPKFAPEFKPVTESYKVNDEVKITGFAKAFSGANITDAKVVYRVHRKVQYPAWCYWRVPTLNTSVQEITNGETVTSEKGEFDIIFKALPEESASPENLPVFTYEITADVTDVNGETRSTTTNVRVGYHSLIATMNVDSFINKNDKKHAVTIDTKNLNGEFVASKGTFKIYKLEAPKSPLRVRPWNAPDYQDIAENEFRTLFPNEAYTNDESNWKNWKKGKKVFSQNFNTKNSTEITLKNIKNWESGGYVMLLETKDKFGQKVKDEKRVQLFSLNDKTVADNNLFTIKTDKNTYEPNENVKLQIGSASKDITVVIQLEKNRKIIDTQLIHLNNEIKTLNFPITKEDLGGFAIKYHYVNYNQFKSGNLIVDVSKKREKIEITTNVFRDKLQPGQEETWSFTVKNDKGDKVAAEVLASMYDASLDEFKKHLWSFNPIATKPKYHSYNITQANFSFNNISFAIKNFANRGSYGTHISKGNYKWFGFSLVDKWTNKYYLDQLKNKLNKDRKEFDGIISGTIISATDKKPLPGVSVSIKGTVYATNTDFDGNYSIRVKKGDVLAFTYIGFSTKETKVNNNFKNLNIKLEVDKNALDKVAVVASKTNRRKSRSKESKKSYGMPSPVKAEVAAEMEVVSFDEDLTGRVSGVMAKPTPETETESETEEKELTQVKARTNLQETAFFFPQLRTNKAGEVSFNFTIPESLTKWKLQLLAHNKQLLSATKTLTTITQKELMVVPNAPRFLREGDKITLSAKISNLSGKNLSGVSQLILTDAVTGKSINTHLANISKTKNFTVDQGGNTSVSWELSIPPAIQSVQYKIVAKAVVTETLPMWVRSGESRTFSLDKLKNNSSSTLVNHKLTLEVTSNPVWYAIQSLPYLMEYPYECAEQTFSRYYANSISGHIANSSPKIQEVFNAWKSSETLLSNLEKNQELKSLLIQETPWLRDAQSEEEQKKRIGLLFDLNKMKNSQTRAINKLQGIQMNSGAFPWFKGGRYKNNFITQHIATGFGHLKNLGISNFDNTTQKMIKKTVKYLDEEFVYTYNQLLKSAEEIKKRAKNKKEGEKKYKEYLAKNNLSYFTIQYLYMRSFYKDISQDKKTKKAVTYYQNQSVVYWNDYNLYAKGQIALSLFRNNNQAVATKIINSLKENSITSDELGMYWKENEAGYYYYQAPVETQSLLIEAFSEIENNIKTIDNLKIWLLKNKQTSQWRTTKATTEAVYALLLTGTDWIAIDDTVDVQVGTKKIDTNSSDIIKKEAGTGYFKTSWGREDITSDMAEVNISKKDKGIAWGGLYWQYFENLDKITPAKTPLQLSKKLFLKTNVDTGKKLTEITNSTSLKVGDLITVRIELRSDRNMEFIHMKDMRASGVEPINVLSLYKYQDGLGYYESTKDASTNFFFDRLPKGIYVFEYDVRINNAGDFSNGITTIQSMYAPEFSSHSKGERITVK